MCQDVQGMVFQRECSETGAVNLIDTVLVYMSVLGGILHLLDQLLYKLPPENLNCV